MSLFDYPRINFVGSIQLNPGTANNDDYAANFTYKGQPLGLIDSKLVEPRTYGMSDSDFIAWVQQVQTVDVAGTPGQTAQTIPAEWNYYGGMDSSPRSVTVAGAQAGNATVPSNLIGAALTFSGVITDVNSEGSPPSTQFFFDNITLAAGGTTFLSGAPSKGACQWLNFYRNVNLTADAGAGGYVYHVIRKGPKTTINLPGFEAPNVAGVIFRYYLYRPISINDNAKIVALYKEGKTNPVTIQMAGTFAPLYDHETIFTGPVGRLMVANTATIPSPSKNNNAGGGPIALAPGVLHQKNNIVSADFIGTFPENYQGNPALPDPKFDFGPVSLVVSAAGASAVIGPVDYTNVAAGNANGWIFDFDISGNAAAQQIVKDSGAAFTLRSSNPALGNVLQETSHYFVSNQQGIYTEQHGSGELFLNQGTKEHATVHVYRHGRELTPAHCPPITVWQYRSIPLESPGNAVPIATTFKPGQPIVVDTSQPGNFLFTFSIDAAEAPPTSYNTFMNPPYITNNPAISLRILPNSVDFSQYYVDPRAAEPVGNDLLTFDVVYQHVLRTYYLLYPVMNQVFPLNSEPAVAKAAGAILARTEESIWMSSGYMPRTRDMSLSRRTLLRAWCRKVLAAKL